MFYLVRHGEIESNIKKVYAGWSDEPLTERGVRQAEKAGELLKDKGIDALYCSPLRRAVQTAEIIGGIIGKTPILEKNFKEMRLGLWEGLSEDEIESRYPEEWGIWNTRPAELRLDGRETLEALQERVLKGVFSRRWTQMNADKKCLTQRRKDAKNLVIVTHVAIIRVIVLYSQGRDLNEYKRVPVANGELFEIDPQITQIDADSGSRAKA